MTKRPSVTAYQPCDIRLRNEHAVFWKRLPSQGEQLFSLQKPKPCIYPAHTQVPILSISCIYSSPKSQCWSGNIASRHELRRKNSSHNAHGNTNLRKYRAVYAPEINLNVSLIVLKINNKKPKDDVALSTLEEHHLMTNKQQKTQENGESLFDKRKSEKSGRNTSERGHRRSEAIGDRTWREKREQKQLLFGGFMIQGFLIALISHTAFGRGL